MSNHPPTLDQHRLGMEGICHATIPLVTVLGRWLPGSTCGGGQALTLVCQELGSVLRASTRGSERKLRVPQPTHGFGDAFELRFDFTTESPSDQSMAVQSSTRKPLLSRT